MNILNLAGELFLLYILYKIIFNFIIPVYQASVKVKKQFNEMQQKMHQQMNTPPPPPTQKSAASTVAEEYIDYEEIK